MNSVVRKEKDGYLKSNNGSLAVTREGIWPVVQAADVVVFDAQVAH